MAATEIPTMLTLWLNTLFLVSRYAHIVAAMVLVGGLLFYETVVPAAIGDLKEEQQIAVFANARWIFRRVIYVCVGMLIATGIYMTFYRMQSYIVTEFPDTSGIAREALRVPWILRTGWWWAAHVISGAIAIFVALRLVSGDRMPREPLGWIKLDLMLLLIVVFFATVTRQVDYIHRERMVQLLQPSPAWRILPVDDAAPPATPPATTQP